MKIPIRHLEDGNHRFEDTLASDQIEFDYHLIYADPVEVTADVNKHDDVIQCKVIFRTRGHYQCDRCLSDFTGEVNDTFQLYLHLGEDQWESDEEDVLHLPEDTESFDITEALAEHLVLALPMKLLCREDCEGLCPGCGSDLRSEACRCDGPDIDPRWEKLRALKNK